MEGRRKRLVIPDLTNLGMCGLHNIMKKIKTLNENKILFCIISFRHIMITVLTIVGRKM